jgi:hypothetical protein
MRGMSGAYAESKYIQSVVPQAVTVVGMFVGEEKGSDGKYPMYAIVSELTASGLELLSTKQKTRKVLSSVH